MHTQIFWCDRTVSILSYNNEPFLCSEYVHGLSPVRREIEVGAGMHQPLPECQAVIRVNVNFVRQFSCEGNAKHSGWNIGDQSLPPLHKLKSLRA